MASKANGASTRVRDAEESLEKIRRLLTDGSGRNLLQGPLLVRPEALRKWNDRWVILDPMTGRLEFKIRRNEPTAKGFTVIDANCIIDIAPLNFHGLPPKYDGCCFYIGTSSRRDYSFAAETPAAARAWVSSLQATQSVLRAHQEAVISLSENGPIRLGTVAAAVSIAKSTVRECSKDIEAAMQITMKNVLGVITNRVLDGPLDDFTVMKETLRVKDEELQSLARDIRARDSTIKDLAEKLSEAAEAAEAAACAARTIDEERKLACAEMKRLGVDFEEQLESLKLKLKESEKKIVALETEREQLIEQKETAIQDSQLWRSELAQAIQRNATLEAAVLRADERVRSVQAKAEERGKGIHANMNDQEAEPRRMQTDPEEVPEVITGTCVDSDGTLTKPADLSVENVDEACHRA